MFYAHQNQNQKGKVSGRTMELNMPYHHGKKKKKKKNGKKKKGGMKKRKGLTAKQKKLPMALQRAILKKQRGR